MQLSDLTTNDKPKLFFDKRLLTYVRIDKYNGNEYESICHVAYKNKLSISMNEIIIDGTEWYRIEEISIDNSRSQWIRLRPMNNSVYDKEDTLNDGA